MPLRNAMADDFRNEAQLPMLWKILLAYFIRLAQGLPYSPGQELLLPAILLWDLLAVNLLMPMMMVPGEDKLHIFFK